MIYYTKTWCNYFATKGDKDRHNCEFFSLWVLNTAIQLFCIKDQRSHVLPIKHYEKESEPQSSITIMASFTVGDVCRLLSGKSAWAETRKLETLKIRTETLVIFSDSLKHDFKKWCNVLNFFSDVSVLLCLIERLYKIKVN